MPESHFTTYTREDGTELSVEITILSWGSPGRYSGPPEHCYPAEGPEMEVKAAWGPGNVPVTLTEAEEEAVINHLYENPPEPEEPEWEWEEEEPETWDD